MRIIPRAEWGAQFGNGFGPAPLPAAEVWLHHSVTAAANGAGIIRALEQIGQSRFGGGISYTWPITPDGTVYEGHSVDRQGSHTGGRNDISRAICFVGNYENDHPTDAQIRSAAWLLQHAHGNGWIRAPRLNGGHRDVKQTACPGRHAYAAIPTINQLAAGGPIEEVDMAALDDINARLANIEGFLFRGGPSTTDGPNAGVADTSIMERVEDTQAAVSRLEAIAVRIEAALPGLSRIRLVPEGQITVTPQTDG